MKILSLLALPVLLLAGCATAVPGFKKVQLTDQFWAEGADFGDFNRDGKMDVASGPYWYEGPDFKTRHQYRPLPTVSFVHTNSAGVAEQIPGYEGALGEKN